MQSNAVKNAFDGDEETTWTIQGFAAQFDVTPRTIRFYESKGLLSPDRQAGARIFSQRDHLRFAEIMRAKRLGFSLDDIKIVMDVIDGKVRDKALLNAHKENFKAVIKSLHRRRKDIDTLTEDLTALCVRIDDYIYTEPDETSDVFEFAEAYDAAFRRHLEADGDPLIQNNDKRT